MVSTSLYSREVSLLIVLTFVGLWERVSRCSMGI